jgi:hypothetical protein
LHLAEFGVPPSQSNKLLMRSSFRNPPGIEIVDAVSMLDRRQPVSDGDRRSALGGVVERLRGEGEGRGRLGKKRSEQNNQQPARNGPGESAKGLRERVIEGEKGRINAQLERPFHSSNQEPK